MIILSCVKSIIMLMSKKNPTVTLTGCTQTYNIPCTNFDWQVVYNMTNNTPCTHFDWQLVDKTRACNVPCTQFDWQIVHKMYRMGAKNKTWLRRMQGGHIYFWQNYIGFRQGSRPNSILKTMIRLRRRRRFQCEQNTKQNHSR